MKKKWKILIVVILIVSFAVFGHGKKEEHLLYPSTAVVRELKLKKDIVVFEDGNGNKWEYEGIEDWEIGDVAAMLMDDNGTEDNVFDDEIINVFYGGFRLDRK